MFLPKPFIRSRFMNLYNQFWKYPSINEKPKGYFGIDEVCYWAPDNNR